MIAYAIAALGWAAQASPAGPPSSISGATMPIDSINVRVERLVPWRGAGHYAAADSLAASLLDALAAVGYRDSIATADVLDEWVLNRILWGRFAADTVRAGALRSLEIRRSVFGPASAEAARSLNILGRLASYQGRFAESESTYRHALAIQERVLGPEHADVGRTLINLGNLHVGFGAYEAARDEYLRALAIVKRTSPAGAAVIGSIENNLANTYHNLGEFETARSLYESAVASGEKGGGVELARRLYNYGRLLIVVGELDSAQAILERSLALRVELVGPDHPSVAVTLWRLGQVALARGDTVAAETHLRRAATLASKGPERQRDLAYILGGLARLAERRGDLAAAAALADSSIALHRAFFGPDYVPTAIVEVSTGDLRMRRGEARAALDLYRDASRILNPCCSESPMAADAALGIAVAKLALGDLSGTAEAAIDACDVAAAVFRGSAAGLGEASTSRASDLCRTANELSITAALRVNEPRLVQSAFRSQAGFRAQLIDAVHARHRIWETSADSTVRQLWRELVDATQRLANLWFGSLESVGARTTRAALAERNRLDEALAHRSAEYARSASAVPVTCDALAGALPPGSALVSYVRYGSWVPRDTSDAASRRPPSYAWPERVPMYAAFVMHSGDSSVVGIPLGPASRIDHLIRAWRQSVIASAQHPGGPVMRRLGMDLRAAVWDPLASAIRGAPEVFVVPDGALNLVNLTALPDSGGYLIERGPLLHHLAAERQLIELASTSHGPRRGLLAFGGIDYAAAPGGGAGVPGGATPSYRGPHSACADLRSIWFEPLPSSLKEVHEVRSIWDATVAGTAASAGLPRAAPRMLVGDGATEEAAKREMPVHSIVHLATHGFVLDEACEVAPPGTRGIGGMVQTGGAVRAIQEAGARPLLLAGLAMAGANRREQAHAGEDDGVLTAEEIAMLDLSGVDWAVLSGCNTGVGLAQDGEGVHGLRRAFQIAGAHTLIMSLWPVLDHSALEWMTALYRGRLVARRSTAEAMRDAGLAILRERRRRGLDTSPFYWGAFVAAGDWR